SHQGHADRLLARAGVYHGHLVLQQPQHPDLDGHVGAGNADVTDAAGQALAHVTTPGPSTPGCSKNTCTSSHSTWYAVTCSSLTTLGSAEGATSTRSAALPAAIWPPPPPARAIVSRPRSLAASSPASTLPVLPSADSPSATPAEP